MYYREMLRNYCTMSLTVLFKKVGVSFICNMGHVRYKIRDKNSAFVDLTV